MTMYGWCGNEEEDSEEKSLPNIPFALPFGMSNRSLRERWQMRDCMELNYSASAYLPEPEKNNFATPRTNPPVEESNLLKGEKKRVLLYDPPAGWRYGFPREYLPLPGEELKDTLLRDGYPQKEIDCGGAEHVGFFEVEVEEVKRAGNSSS